MISLRDLASGEVSAVVQAGMCLHDLPDHARPRVLGGLPELRDEDLRLLSILRRRCLRALIRQGPLKGTRTYSYSRAWTLSYVVCYIPLADVDPPVQESSMGTK